MPRHLSLSVAVSLSAAAAVVPLTAQPAAAAGCTVPANVGRSPSSVLLIAKRKQTWYVRGSVTSGRHDLCFVFGEPNDIGVMGDWNGDRERTPGVFRPSTGTWYLSNDIFARRVDAVHRFGSPGDVPVAVDPDGDLRANPGVYRNGTWHLSSGGATAVNGSGTVFGGPSDQPILSSRQEVWNYYRTGTAQVVEGYGNPPRESYAYTYGSPGDRFVGFGNWSGQTGSRAAVGPAVFRPSEATWYLSDFGGDVGGQYAKSVRFGIGTDQALVSQAFA